MKMTRSPNEAMQTIKWVPGGVHVALYCEIDDGKWCSLSSDMKLSLTFSNSSPGLLAISVIWHGVVSLE